MIRLVRLLAVLSLAAPLALFAAPARAADPAAQAFIDGIYSQYRGANTPGIALDGPGTLQKYFEPSLIALLDKDAAEANKKGEVPKLDGDPLIDAQDWDITDVKSAIVDAGKDKAVATVTFRNFKQAKTVKLDLVKVGGAWKIYDIHYGDGGTLRKLLTEP